MPVILITGYPCSGKTTRANELKTFFESEHNLKINIISDHKGNVVRNDLYSGIHAFCAHYRSCCATLLSLAYQPNEKPVPSFSNPVSVYVNRTAVLM